MAGGDERGEAQTFWNEFFRVFGLSRRRLADLYDPLAMPLALVKAHQALNRAVDRAYRPQPFPNEAGRVTFLFERYEALTNALFAEIGKKKRRR